MAAQPFAGRFVLRDARENGRRFAGVARRFESVLQKRRQVAPGFDDGGSQIRAALQLGGDPLGGPSQMGLVSFLGQRDEDFVERQLRRGAGVEIFDELTRIGG